MDHEPIGDDDFEEGQLSNNSDDDYTPLQRPINSAGICQSTDGCSATGSGASLVAHTATTVTKMEEASEQESPASDTDSDSESESGFKTKTKMSKLRIQPHNERSQQLNPTKPKLNKYNIWTSSLQEESLLENLQGCGVDKSAQRDRSIESYDYSLKYRLNGDNSLKRRQSNSDDSDRNFDGIQRRNKRFRANSLGNQRRKNVRLRMGCSKSDDSSSNDGSASASAMYHPRLISDLNISPECSGDDLARQIANNLYEEKDDLMLKVVKVLGKEIPMELFNETKRIESEGGMLILNRMRRRTPGGVFLFLLKNCDKIQKEQKNRIFSDDAKKVSKEQKSAQALQRDRKVAELKKSLRQENGELTALATRSDLILSHLNPETHSNLSNPPPSPVTDCNRENSSDFDTNDIGHMNVTSPEKALAKNEVAKCYEDDFLDVNCDPMDLF